MIPAEGIRLKINCVIEYGKTQLILTVKWALFVLKQEQLKFFYPLKWQGHQQYGRGNTDTFKWQTTFSSSCLEKLPLCGKLTVPILTSLVAHPQELVSSRCSNCTKSTVLNGFILLASLSGREIMHLLCSAWSTKQKPLYIILPVLEVINQSLPMCVSLPCYRMVTLIMLAYCFMPTLRLHVATAGNTAARAKTARNTVSPTHSKCLESRMKWHVWAAVLGLLLCMQIESLCACYKNKHFFFFHVHWKILDAIKSSFPNLVKVCANIIERITHS